jgi:type IV pilus assembly protein PilM
MEILTGTLSKIRNSLGRLRRTTGLDVGSSFVKLVRLRRESGSYILEAAAQAPITPAQSPGDKERNTLAAIRQCFAAAEPDSDIVIGGVSGPEVAVRHFSFPTMPREEIEKAVVLEAAQVCPFAVDNGSVAYQVIAEKSPSRRAENSPRTETIRGIIAAATGELVRARERLIGAAGKKCVLLDIEGLALLNCIEGCGRNGKAAIAVVNVGAALTTVAIRSDEALPYVRDLPLAGDSLIGSIAESAGLSLPEVADALFGPGEKSDKIQPALTQAGQELFAEIGKTIRYSLAQRRTSLEHIFVCGGFSCARGFVELLGNALQCACTLFDPLQKLGGTAGSARQGGPAFAVAAGLAMRSW